MRPAAMRLSRQSSLNVSKTVCEQALLAGNLSEPIERFRIVRGDIKRTPIMLRGLCQTAFAMQPGGVCVP
jgi:hypothetical protein